MWSVIYADDNRLDQFEDGIENLFGSIEQKRIKKFIVSNEYREVIVNLETGEFKVNGIKLDFGYNDAEHRLIYFRRIRQILGNCSGPQIIEYVGWQATIQGSIGPTNIKVILGIGPDRITIQW